MANNSSNESLLAEDFRPDWMRTSVPSSGSSEVEGEVQSGVQPEETWKQVLRRLGLKLALWLSLVGVAVLTVIGIFVVIYRWIAWAMWSVKMSIYGRFERMYGWIDQFSPSDSQPEREEKLKTLRERFFESFQFIVPQDWVRGADLVDILVIAAVVVFAVCGAKVIAKICRRVGKRTVQRIRGIRLEAMVDGSEFAETQMPKCQVAIEIPGTWKDRHNGFGFRFGRFIVTTEHCVHGFDEIILKRQGRNPILVRKPHMIRSRLVDDLVYLLVSNDTMSQLGLANAKFVREHIHNFATCTGLSGTSTGMVSKLPMRGLISYAGSTVPGMSGAPYMINEQVVGMHRGATGRENLGVSSEVIKLDLNHIMQGEALHGASPGADDGISSRFNPVVPMWKLDDLQEMAKERYSSDWAGDQEEDIDFYSRQLAFDESVRRQPAKKVKVNMTSDGMIQVPLAVNLQNGANGTVVRDTLPAAIVDQLVRIANANVIERLEALEAKAFKPKPNKGEPWKCEECTASGYGNSYQAHLQNSHSSKRVKCLHCDVTCRDETKLQNHMISAHVKPESALPEDTGAKSKVVNQKGNFLGKKASNQKKKKSSSQSSSRSNSPKRYQSMEANLLKMAESQGRIEKLFEKFLAVSVGQSSATMQS